MTNRLDMEKFQALSQEIVTCPFRIADLLFCKRKRCGDHIIYSGLDPVDGRYDLFYKKIYASLDLLSGQLYSDAPFLLLFPKRIIGSVSTTRIWHFPWSIEINFDRVFSVPDLYLAGELLYETMRFHYAKMCPSAAARQKARVDEYSYVKNYSGADFDDEKFSKFRSQRPMTEDQITLELKNTLEDIKKELD